MGAPKTTWIWEDQAREMSRDRIQHLIDASSSDMMAWYQDELSESQYWGAVAESRQNNDKRVVVWVAVAVHLAVFAFIAGLLF